jgi:hypothetical protein
MDRSAKGCSCRYEVLLGRTSGGHVKRSRQGRKPGHLRSKEPTDWALYLEPLVAEIEAGLEIVRRLRWAVALSERGLRVAPSPAGRYRPHLTAGIVERLKSPEEMVATLKPLELKQLCDGWESEIGEWGQPIWERRGDTLRLREKRRYYLDQIKGLRSSDKFGDANISNPEAARLVNLLDAEPCVPRHTKSGVRIIHAHVFTDPFGNPLPHDEEQRLLKETKEERATLREDDRTLRRLLTGGLKKSLGGISDIDPRLLRPEK